MANYLSNEIMLELLKEVQQKQIDLLNAGMSSHLDANVHENAFPSDGDTHITFDLFIFDGDTLKSSYGFTATDTEEQNRARIVSLVADMNAMSK